MKRFDGRAFWRIDLKAPVLGMIFKSILSSLSAYLSVCLSMLLLFEREVEREREDEIFDGGEEIWRDVRCTGIDR